jgi:hypothetical protein
VFIHSIYTGPDIGQLWGDVTERENAVFLDWENPALRSRPDFRHPCLVHGCFTSSTLDAEAFLP